MPENAAQYGSKDKFETDVAAAFAEILRSLQRNAGIDASDENFRETPGRVARAYGEIFAGLFEGDRAVKDILSKTFPAKAEEMVVVGPITVWSVCPHHFLPVHMCVWTAYIPRKKVLGLSKLARIAELIAKRPALQEDTTVQIAKTIYEGLEPKGAACVIKGQHLCMEMRGVKKETITTTSALEGTFLNYPEVRAEFMAMVRGDK